MNQAQLTNLINGLFFASFFWGLIIALLFSFASKVFSNLWDVFVEPRFIPFLRRVRRLHRAKREAS
ncbi:hypothetical protein PWG14_26310 [Chromobacterium amazonense]|uniref:hypothetical protein n=1 Tax=Chromobacterium amazonense TaxID=1382803 RepID=UPI00237DA13A|nr:hypothetical protein [Chromobacterium amazonense]MDE1715982.1 hypothetical protein [Chromobacterium amazonense]